MKEINGYLLFPVKENEKDFSITDDDKLRSKNTVNVIIRYRPLPKGNYAIIGLLSEIPEKDLPEDVWQEIANTITEEKLSISNCLILKKIL